MGLWGREDPEGKFVTQRRASLQSFSNDIMGVYDDLCEPNKSLLDTFFGVTEIMLEHHQKLAAEEAKLQAETDDGSGGDAGTGTGLPFGAEFSPNASNFFFCSCMSKIDDAP